VNNVGIVATARNFTMEREKARKVSESVEKVVGSFVATSRKVAGSNSDEVIGVFN
jgi:hypothetical protein